MEVQCRVRRRGDGDVPNASSVRRGYPAVCKTQGWLRRSGGEEDEEPRVSAFVSQIQTRYETSKVWCTAGCVR